MKELRRITGLSQTEFAARMGVPLRTYQDIESGKNPVRKIHLIAAKWVLVQLYTDNKLTADQLPNDVRDTIQDIAAGAAHHRN